MTIIRAPKVLELSFLAGYEIVTDTSFVDIGGASVNIYTGLIEFSTICYASANRTLSIRLYNLTDGVVVDNSLLTTTANVATLLTTALVTLPVSTKTFILQAKLDSNNGSEFGFCLKSSFIF